MSDVSKDPRRLEDSLMVDGKEDKIKENIPKYKGGRNEERTDLIQERSLRSVDY